MSPVSLVGILAHLASVSSLLLGHLAQIHCVGYSFWTPALSPPFWVAWPLLCISLSCQVPSPRGPSLLCTGSPGPGYAFFGVGPTGPGSLLQMCRAHLPWLCPFGHWTTPHSPAWPLPVSGFSSPFRLPLGFSLSPRPEPMVS